ncbi:hypothetical protein [Candidatus Pelagibacter sp.]|uniref:hypothetical protein n=1 Tax=Candidatus Pelagibacter sp. TaxID=2024849 RepID=UPI003F870640
MKKEKTIFNFLAIYLIILLVFSYFFLFTKHQVGNDSTISEWLINYEGGFTKRGLIGQIAIEISRLFNLNLRITIFFLQSFVCTIYFILLFNFLKNLKLEKIVILSIFTPIFILYPVAEIEVLARKEIIIFSLYLIYLLVPNRNILKIFSFIVFTSISMLVWEPVIFFFPIIFLLEIIEKNIENYDVHFYKILFLFVPSLMIASIFIFDPLNEIEWNMMASILKSEFDQNCYMSCFLLKSKSTIIQQFQGNYGSYSLEVFIRYFFIILIGFYPLFTLIKNSKINNYNLVLFKHFVSFSKILLFSLTPVILLFAMGYDWGRWVNISYIFLLIIFFQLLKHRRITINYENLRNTFIYKLKRKTFIFFFVIFCFGWNPKTVITGDVASFPGYRIPYKVFKIINN